jgi:hypothetical protein
VERSRVADHGRLVITFLVRVDFEVAELESGRSAVVQVEDDALGAVTALHTIPARSGDASSVGPVGSERTFKVDKREVGDACAGLVGVFWARAFVLVVVTVGAGGE